jgi:preprotein translocase subunit SecD
MNMIKKIFTNWRVLLMLAFLVMAIVALRPSPWHEGITIRSVAINSSASEAGMVGPKATAPPVTRERILRINNMPVNSVADFFNIEQSLAPNVTVLVETSEDSYRMLTRIKYNITELGENETIIIEETHEENTIQEITVNGTTQNVTKTINVTKNVTKTVPKVLKEAVGVEPLGIKVYENPTTNIRKGLDLQGGTRVIIQPETNVSNEMMELILSNMKQRLNVYGLSDIVVRVASDFFGNQFIMVEIAGANEDEVRELLSRQGKFEAKVGGKLVFIGGERDITYVAMSNDQAGIDPYSGCRPIQDGYACSFRFSITLSQTAAERMADITAQLEVIPGDGTNDYLNESIDLILDDQIVDSLQISADLQGKVSTDILITGSGTGRNEQEAIANSLENMKRLRTIVATGSLPVKINIVKTDNLSPTLGHEFISNSFVVGLFALLAISLVISIRYRKAEVLVPMVLISIVEIIIIFGMAALIGWNLDLAAIAGIIIVIGTGIDHLIVVTDEVLGKEKSSDKIFTWRTRIKNAFYIITAAYLTTFVAMFPLWFAGAGMLKGFALTTIIGISVGVFITRPAYAAIIEQLMK